MSKQTSLKLSLTETNGSAHAVLLDDNEVIVNFENIEAPAVRVVGFKARGARVENLLAFMDREADSFGSQELALEAVITSFERQLYDKLKLLRKEIRKMAMLGHSYRSARMLHEKIIASQKSKELNKKAQSIITPNP